MIDMTNPATRLEHWLQVAHAQIPKVDKQKAQVHAYETFCGVWGITPDSENGRAEFLRRAAAMLRLGTEVRLKVEAAEPTMGPAALEHFDQVERVLDNFMRPKGRLHEFFAPIEQLGWYSLSLCSRLLTVGVQPQLLDEPALDSLIEQTRGLIDQIRNASDIDDSSKADLVARLRAVEDALAAAGVTGTQEVEAAVDGLVGSMVRLAMRGSSVIHHPVAQSVFGLINAITAIVGVGADVASLADGGLTTLKELAPGRP